MGSNYLPDEVTQWLYDNQELTNFLTLQTRLSMDQDKNFEINARLEMNRQAQILHFSKVLENTKNELNELPPPEPFEKANLDSANKCVWLNHFRYFVKVKQHKIKKKILIKLINDIDKVIQFFRIPDIPPHIDISFDMETYCNVKKKLPPHYYSLESYIKKVNIEYGKGVSAIPTLEQVRNILFKILDYASKQIDRSTFYFPNNNIQQRFDQLIMSKTFPFIQDVHNILSTFTEEPKSKFTSDLLQLFEKISHFFGITNPIQYSCCFLMLFRSMFSYAYGRSPSYFYTNTSDGIRTISHKITCNFLELPEEIIPEDKKNLLVTDVFKSNEFFKRGGMHLVFSTFYTNPIDALNEINEMIHYNEKGVLKAFKKKPSLFSFEVNFGTFLGTTIASDLPNFEDLASFIANFTPKDVLCPEFQFAVVITTAALTFCSTIKSNFS
ncbi:hypothetical protein GPJ56_008092 [Histomonas meleagridis]|uniref:uncharacterized protein n=1 Tax=Histomonas meleagridis TaxID=135588 RepID=UPI003559E09C|nr:hypothetical protein GPJ56_008092 [Histomonas meleagridis]KAH0798957.1 hypothetical protein GO595_008247 [Histomonas meleagridis]